MRLIDADELKTKLFINEDNWNPVVTEKEIDEAPTIEAVLVVRCKDCEHSGLPAVLTLKYGKLGTLTCHNLHSPCNNRNVNKNDFCSHGAMMKGADMRKKVAADDK